MTKSSRWLLGPVLALALAGLPGITSTASASDAPLPTPAPTAHRVGHATKLFAKAQSGKHALKSASASTLKAAALVNRMSTSHLQAVLSSDPTIAIGTDGRLFYADTLEATPTNPAADDKVAAAQWATYPLADTFHLHSGVGSKHTIYLNFTGNDLQSDSWWVENGGIPAGSYDAFSMDADTSTNFSTAEQQYIQDVWRIVAEKYSAMDVDVTTEYPDTDDAWTRTSASDDTYGTHVVITSDMSARSTTCTATSAGGCVGQGLIDVFNTVDPSRYLQPAWVYTRFTAADDTLPAGVVANDAAHEIGHTLGLYHDRLTGTDYYPGHNDWFPIMGSSDRAIGQFNNGGYTGAVTDQVDPGTSTKDADDFKVMHQDGLPTRADDVSGTKALGSAASYSEGGIIETAADVDAFQVNRTCTSTLTATATGIGLGQSVDLKVTIKDPNGIVKATADPAAGHLTPRTVPDTPTGTDASAHFDSATPGLWTISVEGVGLAGSTGYTDYGSVGQYNLVISGCAGSSGTAPGAPTGGSVSLTARSTTATIHWAAPVNTGSSALTGYSISGTPNAVPNPAPSATSATLTGLVPGTTYPVKVAATNSDGGNGVLLPIPVRVHTWMPTTAPSMRITISKGTALIDFIPPSNPGHATFTNWRLTVGGTVYTADATLYTGISNLTGFRNGTYNAKLALLGISDLGTTTPTNSKNFVSGATAPRIGAAVSGKKRGPKTAGIRWAPPVSLGGYPITGYRAIAYKLNSKGKVVKSYASGKLRASARSYSGKLPAGRYKFRVVAYNANGLSPYSAYSKAATSR